MKKFLLLITCFVFFAGNIDVFPQVGNQIPIAPNSIPQFVDPLPHFAGARVNAKAGGNLKIKMVPNDQIALSTGTVVNGGIIGGTIDTLLNTSLGKAHVWTYRISTDNGLTYTPANWPSFTIEAQRGNGLTVEYSNELTGETYDKVGLKADQTLHWANPLGAPMTTMTPYTGAIPVVPHLHGGEVPSESDGGPDGWFTPGFGITGPSWAQGVDQNYNYPNTQEEATIWIHDHALGATRLNVYAGMALFYFLRGPVEEAAQLPGWSGDNTVQQVDRVTGLPFGNPYLPEIELAIQDRMFDTNGKLYYPNLPPNPMMHPFWTPEFVGDIITVNGKTWPYLSVAPRKYRFRIVNGSNARFYELWLQDLVTGTFGPIIYQVGTDGGLLDAPVPINPALGGKLLLGPGERADIIIDFTGNAPGTVWTVRNSGRTPYPFGTPAKGSTVGRIMQFVVNGTMNGPDLSQIPAAIRTTPLIKLTNFAGATDPTITGGIDKTRQLTLNEVMGMGGPLEVLVNNTKWDADGGMMPGLGVTETPTEGKTEVWKIINLTADAHPIHLHLVQFQLVSRQKFNQTKYNKAYSALFTGSLGMDPITGMPYEDHMTGLPPTDPMTGLPFPAGVYMGGYGPPVAYDAYYNSTTNTGWLGGNPDVTPFLQGPVKPANPNERGWKDTFIMYPGEVTTVVVRFAPTDLATTTSENDLKFAFDPSEGPGYVWHCHIIDHEDNEMMRPYTVNPNPARLSKIGTLADATITDYMLAQNYPNPFNPTTTINFSVPDNAFVNLKVYNSIGAEVGTLINQEVPKGNHRVEFDAAGLSSGMYFYTLSSGHFKETKKMLLLK